MAKLTNFLVGWARENASSEMLAWFSRQYEQKYSKVQLCFGWDCYMSKLFWPPLFLIQNTEFTAKR